MPGLGLGMGLAMVSAHRPLASLLASIFDGSPWAMFDFNDLSTVRQDSLGSTAGAAGGTIGLVQDKSQGLALTPVPGASDFATNWTDGGSSMTRTATLLSNNGTNAGTAQTQYVNAPTGWRKFTFTYTNIAGGNVAIFADASSSSVSITGSGSVTLWWYGTAAGSSIIRFPAGVSGSISVSMSLVPGYHLIQTTPGARPGSSARVNRALTNLGTDWSADNLSRVTGQADPFGGTTAVLLTTTVASSARQEGQASWLRVGTQRVSVYFKAGTAPYVGFGHYSGLADGGVSVNTSTLALNYVGTYFSDGLVEAVAGYPGWYRLSALLTTPAIVTGLKLMVSNSPDPGGNSTTGQTAYFCAPQIEWGMALSRFQRVTSATDYDTAGFPVVVASDGVDDWLQASNGPDGLPYSDARTVFLVARTLASAGGTNRIFGVVSDESIFDDATGWRFYQSNGAIGGTRGQLQVVGYTINLRSAGGGKAFVNGVPMGALSPVSGVSARGFNLFAEGATGSSKLAGEIACMVIANKAVTDAQAAQISRHLAALASLTQQYIGLDAATKQADLVISMGGRKGSCTLYDPYAQAKTTPLVSSGKRYFEFSPDFTATVDDAEITVGVCTASYNPALNGAPGSTPNTWELTLNGKVLFNGGYAQPVAHANRVCTDGGTSRCAVDIDAGKGWFGNALGFAGDPVAGTNPDFTFTPGTPLGAMLNIYTVNQPTPVSVMFNFGSEAFTLGAPAGYLAWNAL